MKLIKQKLGKVSITVDKDYWSDQKSYDRLVIVEVVNIGAYISRKEVPVGIQYTNREYWIRLGYNSGGGGGGSDIEVVTDFGDSIVKVICQKTITDKVTEIENNFGNYYTKQIQDQSTDGIYNRIDQVEETLGYEIRTNKRNIENLQQFENTTRTELNSFSRDINKHTEAIATISTDVGRLQSNDDSIFEALGGINNSITNLERITDRAFLTEIKQRNVLYIGGKLSRSDTFVINSLKDGLKKTEGVDFFTYTTPFLTGQTLVDIVDGNIEIEGLSSLVNSLYVIVQTDTSTETVGTTSDFPATPDLSGTYASTVYGQYTYFVDKLRSIQPSVQIFFVSPPNNEYDISEVGEKPYAIKDVANITKSDYLDLFKFRYKDSWASTAQVEGVNKVVLGTLGVFALSLLRYWATSISNAIKLKGTFGAVSS